MVEIEISELYQVILKQYQKMFSIRKEDRDWNIGGNRKKSQTNEHHNANERNRDVMYLLGIRTKLT